MTGLKWNVRVLNFYLGRHPDIHYYEVDTEDLDYQDLIELVKIDKVEVGHMPSFLVVNQGLGYTIHGETAIDSIVKELSGKDWWLAYRHQRTQAEVEAEARAAAAAASANTASTAGS